MGVRVYRMSRMIYFVRVDTSDDDADCAKCENCTIIDCAMRSVKEEVFRRLHPHLIQRSCHGVQ